MKRKTIGVIGLIATGLGMVAQIVSHWAGEKQMDARIDDRAAAVFNKLHKG